MQSDVSLPLFVSQFEYTVKQVHIQVGFSPKTGELC